MCQPATRSCFGLYFLTLLKADFVLSPGIPVEPYPHNFSLMAIMPGVPLFPYWIVQFRVFRTPSHPKLCVWLLPPASCMGHPLQHNAITLRSVEPSSMMFRATTSMFIPKDAKTLTFISCRNRV